MVGRSEDPKVNELVKEEQRIHGDVVQEDFLDTYRNLTLKTIMGLRWTSLYCSNAKFVLKIDDDVILNTKNFIEYLELERNQNLTKMFLCNLFYDAPVIRDPSSKWFVTYEEYQSEHWGKYCEGPAYLMTGDLVEPLFNMSFQVRKLHLEDVYVGMLGAKLNASFVGIYEHYVWWKWDPFYYLETALINQTYIIYTLNMVDYFDIWNRYIFNSYFYYY